MYAVIPFIYFSRIQNFLTYQETKNSIIYSGIVFSILSLFFYSSFIFNFGGRIDMLVYSSGIELNIINPLIFSYVAALTIGLIGFDLILNVRINSFKKKIYFFGIVISLVPLILGASKGSIIALIFPFIYYVFFNKKKQNFILISYMICFGIIVYIFTLASGSTLFTRFFVLFQSLNSFERVKIWQTSLIQASESPFFGNGLQNLVYNHYPHNIFIEYVMSTGLLGIIIFLIIISYGFYISRNIINKKNEIFWVVVIFQQGLIQALFTGAIADSIFLWVGLGLVSSSHPLTNYYSK